MIVVAGHVCLDIIPKFESRCALDPGSLVRVGAATLSTGGVSNVGVALHRLGTPVKLIHKVGDDRFGDAIKSILNERSPELASGIRTVPGETTSYSVVVAPVGVDRMFIHCPGANDTFGADDVSSDALQNSKHFHLGYPPIMRRIAGGDGIEARQIFRTAGRAGCRTSLDMCSVDPHSETGRTNWAAWLANVLPEVDLFTPSFDELAVMLGHPATFTRDSAVALANRCLAFGCRAVLMKLGDRGVMYCNGAGLRHQPCFAVDVVTTNGAGDCTIAGFLAAQSMGESIDRSLEIACAVGASCCEAADATSGVTPLVEIEKRLGRGWQALEADRP